ncbi:SDR family NAD(P)-dependent oxidoreductase [Amycolatopsis lexingtonensis]|uniref:SDR family NAD(P)-dependent oxidoreductase n=1 Tax=Amycolatopsis lexingtonensis TaxID=218822 RepID=UPI003F720437
MSTVHPPAGHLAERVVIVTGAGSGIGRAVAVAFAEVGAHVLGVGRRPDALAETAREHPGIGTFAADVCSADAPEAIVEEARRRWGRVDVLVNNAGAAALVPLAEVTLAGIDGLFALNVTAPSLLARAALPHLRAVHGSIVNVSSTFGHRPLPGGSHYAASKSAVEMLTRSWAVELAPERIRVNAVAPGPTESDARPSRGSGKVVAARSARRRGDVMKGSFMSSDEVNDPFMTCGRPIGCADRTLPDPGPPGRLSARSGARSWPGPRRSRRPGRVRPASARPG